jgi:hypothetical protein
VEDAVAETEKHEHKMTQKALDRLAKWGNNVGIYGGENIAFCLSRQGAPIDAFLCAGDCTPFTPSGKRGTLKGQPPADTGAPVAYFIDFTQITPGVIQVPCIFSFDLNLGKVSLNGAFPNLPASLDFTVEYDKEFSGNDGYNLLFHSEKTSDNAGYIITIQHVAATA